MPVAVEGDSTRLRRRVDIALDILKDPAEGAITQRAEVSRIEVVPCLCVPIAVEGHGAGLRRRENVALDVLEHPAVRTVAERVEVDSVEVVAYLCIVITVERNRPREVLSLCRAQRRSRQDEQAGKKIRVKSFFIVITPLWTK